MILWLFVKLFFLYTFSFLFSVSFYFYLNRTLLPPHRTLQFPIIWREEEGKAVVELDKGQRLGGNFYLQGTGGGKAGEVENGSAVINANVPYDISLLLRYPDRPEIADLGNLKFSLKMIRRDGTEAGQIDSFRALRYENKILRLCKEVLGVPAALWKDSGSERIERISLVERLVDATLLKKDFEFNAKKDTKALKNNPIDRLEVSISPLPPLHSINLEILANLSPLQHFLFHWRVPAALLVIGVSTTVLWLLVSLYALIEVVKIILSLRKGAEPAVSVAVELGEVEEFEQVQNVVDSENDETDVVSIQFPEADSVANFIGDLRKRKLKKIADEEVDELSVYNSEAEDQSVPVDKSE